MITVLTLNAFEFNSVSSSLVNFFNWFWIDETLSKVAFCNSYNARICLPCLISMVSILWESERAPVSKRWGHCCVLLGDINILVDVKGCGHCCGCISVGVECRLHVSVSIAGVECRLRVIFSEFSSIFRVDRWVDLKSWLCILILTGAPLSMISKSWLCWILLDWKIWLC